MPKSTPAPLKAVRTRRAYFDCRFGQLHVRTAFPDTGGFDEQVPLFCLHPDESSSRMFTRFLPEIAHVRSAYAPDLPGRGESDPSPSLSAADAAAALSDLADDLRLRQIDLLGVHAGTVVALDLAAGRPELVRRLVLVGIPASGRIPTVKQPGLVMRTQTQSAEGTLRAKTAVPNGRFVDFIDYPDFEAEPKRLAQEVGAFLTGNP